MLLNKHDFISGYNSGSINSKLIRLFIETPDKHTHNLYSDNIFNQEEGKNLFVVKMADNDSDVQKVFNDAVKETTGYFSITGMDTISPELLYSFVKPKLIKSKNCVYKDSIMISFEFVKDFHEEDRKKKISNFLNSIFSSTGGEIYFLRESEDKFYFLVESASPFFTIANIVDSVKESREARAFYLREYSFRKNSKTRIFAPKDMKPVYYDFIYKKNVILFIDEEENLKVFTKFQGHDSNTSFVLKPVWSFFEFAAIPEKLSDIYSGMEMQDDFFEINLFLSYKKKERKNIDTLKKEYKEKVKEAAILKKEIARHEENGESGEKAGFFIYKSDLEKLGDYIYLLDQEDRKNIKVFKFVQKDHQDRIVYFIYGDEYLLPAGYFDIFSTEHNYSTNNIKILCSSKKSIYPAININENEKTAKRFYDLIFTGIDDYTKYTKDDNYIVILDNEKKYFNSLFTLLDISLSITLNEFIDKHAILSVSSQISKISSNVPFGDEKNYTAVIDKKINEFYSQVCEETEQTTEDVISQWNKSHEALNKMQMRENERLNKLEKHINFLSAMNDNFFKSQNIYTAFKAVLENFTRESKDLSDLLDQKLNKELMEVKYNEVLNRYKKMKDEISSLNNQITELGGFYTTFCKESEDKCTKNMEIIKKKINEFKELDEKLYSNFKGGV